MQNKLSVLINNNSITICFTEKADIKIIQNDHPSFREIQRTLKDYMTTKDDYLIDQIYTLCNAKSYLKTWLNDRLKLSEDGTATLDDRELPPLLAQRLMTLFEQGYPCDALVNFACNLWENPSNRSATQLYSFLENKNIPITDDGCFVAYKAVRSDYYDLHSGTFLNAVGSVIEMPRAKVDDDPNRTCSHGLHVGALPYVLNFGGSHGKVLLVKVNPRDVVSVPVDYNGQKMRVCRYEVISEYKGALPSSYVHEEDLDEYDYEDENEYHLEEIDFAEFMRAVAAL